MSVMDCSMESDKKIKQRRILRTIAAIAGTIVTAVVASLATDTTSAWYANLVLSPIQPPPWVFGAVWTPLYVLLAISFAHIASRRHVQTPVVIGLIINLVLNALWSPVFFLLYSPAWALVVMGAMIVNLVIILLRVFRTERAVFYMLLPYLAWLTIATILNVSIIVLN